MTVATYNTNLTELVGDTQTNSTTGWTALGGGAAGLNAAETDYFIEQAQCLTKNAFASATKGMIYDTGSDAGGSGTDGAYSIWMTHTAPNSLATRTSGGMRFLIGSGSGAYRHYYIGGSDTMTFLKWVFGAVKEQNSNWDNTTGTPSATVEQWFGGLWNLPSGGPTKGAPNAIDTVRVGRHDIVIEFGTGADPEATFDGVLTNLETATNRWGLLVQREPGGPFENSGLIQFGTSTNAVEFTDSDKTITLRDHPHVTANFHTWEANNASSIITLTNVIVKALGTTSRGRWVTNNNATLNWTTCSFVDMGTFGFGTNSTIDTCTFLRCDQITHAGAVMNGSSVLASNVAADTGAVSYNLAATDPDGEMDNMKFSQGATAHHAIDFGTNVTSDITLRGCEFNGFDSTADSNGATFRFLATSGSLTLNLVGCKVDGANASEANIGIDDAAGINVSLVISPVTTSVHVNDENGNDYTAQNARVYIRAKDGTGPMPYQDSVTLTHTTTTAHVAHTAHGLKDGQKVLIEGADQTEYNGVSTITNVTTNAYDYTMPSDPGTNATGTTIATAVIIDQNTNATGDASEQRALSANQPVVGWVRKGTGSPYYEEAGIDDVIDKDNGLTLTIKLVLDE